MNKFEKMLVDGTVNAETVLNILKLLQGESFHDATLTLKTAEYLIKTNVYLDYPLARDYVQSLVNDHD